VEGNNCDGELPNFRRGVPQLFRMQLVDFEKAFDVRVGIQVIAHLHDDGHVRHLGIKQGATTL